MHVALLFAAICLIVLPSAISQKFSSDSINAFSIDLLAATAQETDEKINVALSPLTVWTLFTIISEGASGNTERQLQSVLRLPADKKQLRSNFKLLQDSLLKEADGVQFELSNGIFTNDYFKLKPSFQDIAKRFYNVDVNPVNFNNPREAVNTINNYVAKATNNRITRLLIEDDVRNAEIFLTSTMYFRGQWKDPFNKTATKRDSFYNEKGMKVGEVDMMYKIGVFPYARLSAQRCHAVELPYGLDNKMSMILILPFKSDSLLTLLNTLSKTKFSFILKTLEDAEQRFVDDEVQVYLPKFTISSDFYLNRVLDKMGIKDVFDSSRAELLGILNQYLFVSRIVQKAEIEVNEEGTVASAAAGASVSYKSPPPKFQANRPFLYFIVDKETDSIVFSGKFSNPKPV